MERIDARRESPGRIAEHVAAVIFGGGTVIFPTDTVYGIGCDPVDRAAVERIYALKGRPRAKPLVLHLGSVTEALEYAPENELAHLYAGAMLPGPLTLVVARPAHVPSAVTAGLPSVGLRVPAHALSLVIFERCGPLAATSANRSGAEPYTGTGVLAGLGEADLLVDAGPTPLGAESSVLDVTGREPRLLREGVLSAAMIDSIFRHSTAHAR